MDTDGDDDKTEVKVCGQCKKCGKIMHAPRTEMGGILTVCPFDKWGIDRVGILPMAPGGKVFLIVAVNYFSKWVEAKAVEKIDKATIQKFP